MANRMPQGSKPQPLIGWWDYHL